MRDKLKQSITTRILAMKFASEFTLIYPLYTIMFGDRGGLSAAAIGTILAASSIMSVLLEIPTGIIADKVPRKYVLISAIISKILGLLIWLGFPFFTGYLLGAMMFALSYALDSGALQAYLYGTLGDDAKNNFGKFWSRVSSMLMISWASSFVVASAIGVNYPALIVLSVLTCLVGLGIAATLPRDQLSVAKASVKPKIFAGAINHIKNTPSLSRLLIGALIILAMAEVLIEYLSLYYYQVGNDVRHVPLFMAGGNVIGAVLFWTLHSWEAVLDKHKLTIMLLMTLLFAATFSGGVVLATVGVLLYTRFIRVLQVQFDANMQHLSNEESRATITSIAAFSAKTLSSAMILIIGFFAVQDSIVKPFRITMLLAAGVFIATQLLARARQARA